MNKKELLILGLILVIAVFFRYYYWTPDTFGADARLHYLVVEQALNAGKLSNDNNLALCYEGLKNLHPIGYYAGHYFLGKLIGLQKAFEIIPVFFGVVSIFLLFFFVKLIFNKKMAFIAAFLVAISTANISRTFPQSFRGDMFLYPFILLSLFFILKAFKEELQKKQILYAVLAGIASSVSSLFWNGYALLVLIYSLSIVFYISFQYVRKKNIARNVDLALLSVFIQAGVMFFIYRGFTKLGKLPRWEGIYFLGIFLLVLFLFILRTFQNKKYYLAVPSVFVMIGLIAAFFSKERLMPFILGFGSIRRVSTTPQAELLPTSLIEYWVFFGIVLLIAIVGFLLFFRKFSEEKAFLLGLIVPSIFLLIIAFRFVFFSSFVVVLLAAYFIDLFIKFDKSNIRINTIVSILLLLAIFVIGFYRLPILMKPLDIDYFDGALNYIDENAEEDACIFAFQAKSTYVQFYTKRYTFLSSIEDPDSERNLQFKRFLLTNSSPDFPIKNGYIFLEEDDIRKTFLHPMATELGLKARIFSTIGFTEERRNEYFSEQIKNNPDMFCSLQGENFYLFNEKACGINLVKMLGKLPVEGVKLWYADDATRIYKIIS